MHTDELHNLCSSINVIRIMKRVRLVARTGEIKNKHKA